MPDPLDSAVVRALVRRALEEDVGPGDITTRATVSPQATASGVFVAKSACVLAGLDVVREVFAQVDGRIRLDARRADGDRCEAGSDIAHVNGPASALLTGERTALNFLQHLSGIATTTRAFVDAADGRVAILDTRKTLPGFRALAKYAVRCGGGRNHRTGLHDGILIKDNHIRLAGGVQAAVERVRASGSSLPIEVEAQSAADVDAALAAGADVIMLDNFDDEATRAAVAHIGRRARVELSGAMTLERVRALAASGADEISVGALTHSPQAADISLELFVASP
jgi:nicotinate-nucleotide pyrophosphorylase (carboxylating)